MNIAEYYELIVTPGHLSACSIVNSTLVELALWRIVVCLVHLLHWRSLWDNATAHV